MGVTSVVQDKSRRGGQWSLEGGFSLSATVYVRCTPDTGPDALLRAIGLPVGATYRYPLVGTPTETNDLLFMQAVNIDSIDPDGCGAYVTATFTRFDPSKDEKGPTDEDGNRDPFAAPPKIGWASDTEDLALTHDKAGQPLLNTAGEPYESGIVIPISTPVAVVSRTVRFFDPAWIVDYSGRINSAEWMGFPAGSVLCKLITADRRYIEEVEGYGWDVEYRFAFKPPIEVDDGGDDVLIRPGWSAVKLNAGLREKVSGSLKAIITADGSPVASPYALKSDGSRLGPSDDPVYNVHDVYPEADFADLGLPSDLFSAGTPEV